MIDELSPEEVSAHFQHRLMSVFSLAEQHIFHCLDKTTDNSVRESVSQKKAFFQTTFLKFIVFNEVEIHYEQISGCLGAGLNWFYTQVGSAC